MLMIVIIYCDAVIDHAHLRGGRPMSAPTVAPDTEFEIGSRTPAGRAPTGRPYGSAGD